MAIVEEGVEEVLWPPNVPEQTGINRIASGGTYIPYVLYVNAALTYPWTTAASNSSGTVINDCYLGAGAGAAQSVNIYGEVPTVTVAPAPGAYSDTVVMTITY